MPWEQWAFSALVLPSRVGTCLVRDSFLIAGVWFPLPGPQSASVGVWLHPRTWNFKYISVFFIVFIYLFILTAFRP